MTAMRQLTVAVAVAIASASFSYTLRAEAGNEAAAQALFEEAKKLVGQGKFAEACPKFAESNKLDRGAGTLIHLADCYEKNKQSASAWATYKEAASAAQALNRKDWEKLANQRATALEPKLAKLTIKVDKSEKVEVTRDGTPVSEASWGVPLPVDLGEHTVEATGKDKKPFKTTTSVAKDGATVEVTVPKLEAADTQAAATPPPTETPAPPPNPEPKPASGGGQKTIGLVVLGVGVLGLGVGAVTGLMAMGKSADAEAACPTDGRCSDRAAVDAADSARTFGLISTIGFIAGGVATVGGLTLFLTAPDGNRMGRLRLQPTLGGAVLGGSF
jgi:hypothetical protein